MQPCLARILSLMTPPLQSQIKILNQTNSSMDPIGYIKRNKMQIERSSRENWVEIEIGLIIEKFIDVIKRTISRKEDEGGTNQFYDYWLRSLLPEHEGFYRQWLIRAFDGDLSFVYARNALIRSLNRDLPRKGDHETVEKISTRIWEFYLRVRDDKNLNTISEEICHYFPNVNERHQFLSFAILQQKKDITERGPLDKKRLSLLEALRSETIKEIEEKSSMVAKKRDKPQNTTLAEFDHGAAYVSLFKEPDREKHAELVKVVLDEMGLTKNGNLAANYNIEPNAEISLSVDKQKINKNTLAYVFAALKDPENGICNLLPGYNSKLVKVFYREFDLTVSNDSASGSVTIRNLRKVLTNENRNKHSVYKDFSLRYKEKLKASKLA